MLMLKASQGQNPDLYKTEYHPIFDGTVFDNGKIKVEARHNIHIQPVDEKYVSYSFIIYAEGKRIVYTADLKNRDELDSLIEGGCDALITETGHHKPDEVCAHLKEKDIGKLLLVHHGRALLNSFEETSALCRSIMPEVVLCKDKDVFEI